MTQVAQKHYRKDSCFIALTQMGSSSCDTRLKKQRGNYENLQSGQTEAQGDKQEHYDEGTYFGASFHMFAVVELDPGVPAVTVQREAIPLVQQHSLFRTNHSKPRSTVKPATNALTTLQFKSEEWKDI